ncbi:MAG: glycine cleavage system protein H, partial [Gammaproteobacteria bacterium]|nr:glycine cleavage system protein H [Gammaproteobacteria bacterium]
MRYSKTHEWISDDGKVGITTHAQKELGEIVHVE